MNRSMNRGVLAALLLTAGLGLAQPVNDTCAGAEEVLFTTNPAMSSLTSLAGASLTTEAPSFSCITASGSNASVWYKFTAPTTESYVVTNCATAQTLSDTLLAVYTGTDCGTLAEVASGCNDDFCSFRSLATVSLTAGTTYWVQVAKWGSTAPVATDTIQIAIARKDSNDLCAGATPLQLDTPRRFAITPLMTNDAIITSACFSGVGNTTTSTGAGRDAVFTFTPPADGGYSIRMSRQSGVPGTTPDPMLYMVDSCVTATTPPQTYVPPQCKVAANRTTTTTSVGEELICVPLQGGVPVTLIADEVNTTASYMSYDLEVNACFTETEPNGTAATANTVLACPTWGSINVAAEVDFFSLGSQPAGARVFAMAEAAPANASNDFDLRVNDGTNTLEYDASDLDTPMGGSAPVVAGTPLSSTATNYLRLNANSATATLEPYKLYAAVQTASPSAEAEPNDTLATATKATGNFFSGDTALATDLDLYEFSALAGDMLFIALDSYPSRAAGVTAVVNHNLALLDAAGLPLVVVDNGTTTVSTTSGAGSLTVLNPTSPAEGIVWRARTAGKYYARVGRPTTATTNPTAYNLSVTINCLPSIGAPVLTGISPTTGSILGGSSHTLSGTNISPAAAVFVGGVRAQVTAANATSITFILPPGNEGPVAIRVVNPGDQSGTFNGFSYFAPVLPPTVVSVSPTSGPTIGGTLVTINGTLFKPGAEVSFTVGTTTLQSSTVTVVSALQVTAVAPPHFPGSATITVRNPVDALEGSLAGAYTYYSPPTVSLVTPGTGLTDGGTLVTVSGADFRAGATVLFGSTAGTAVALDGGFELSVVTPASALNGPVNVTVRNVDNQVGILDGGFVYQYPAPTLTSVAPAFGALDGGTLITLTGTNFFANPAVLVGGAGATSVTRVSNTSITARTPAGAAGFADVTIVNSDLQNASLTNSFEYVGPPTVTSVTPATGFTLGGTNVTVNGTGFRTGATVRFGTSTATVVSIDPSGTSAVVTIPSATVNGVVAVSVTNTDAQVGTLASAFTYLYPAPIIASVVPNSGFSTGGTNITVNGVNFFPGVTLTVGGTAVTNLVRSSATKLTATTPPGAAGPADVVVGNTDGQSITSTGGFTYVPSPVVASISPNHGPVQGGTLVTLTGSNFLPGATVFFGGTPAFAVNVTSPTTATAVTNSSAASVVDVKLINPDTQSNTLAMAFTYDPAPTLVAAAPSTGSTAGGTTVTLTGTGFLTGATVLFGTDAATAVNVTSATQLTAVSPAHAAGVVSLTVKNADGQLAELPRSFRFVAPPTFASLSPTSGNVAGGTLVTLTGTGFTPNATVTFGGTASAQVAYVSATELTAVTPAHTRGAVDVVVTSDGASASLANAFTYERGAPTLTQVAPLSGPVAGGVALTLTGTGFVDGASITLGGVAATDVVVVSSGLARAVVPAHAAGAVDVVFTNDDAQAATLTGGFTYVAPPSGDMGLVTDGGSGSLGTEPVGGGGGEGGVSCGCTSVDGSMVSIVGLALAAMFSRRRRR